jgi:hypothetical protein
MCRGLAGQDRPAGLDFPYREIADLIALGRAEAGQSRGLSTADLRNLQRYY